MSKNYFDIEKEFFLIDSENMHDAVTKLYGYSIQDNGIIEEVNRTEENIKGLNGCGTYVYVEKRVDEVIIKQDFNASYGLFLYQNGDYFAISNSFQRLVDGLKKKYPLTLNRDYANHMIAMELASLSVTETMVKEINILPRNIVVTINLKKGGVQLGYIDYEEEKYAIDSVEGIQLLDEWYARWTKIFRCVKEKTNNLTISLSGGFDSRITFMLALKSGINLNEVRVHSIKDDLHTHSEDYEIASEIAEYYDFQLNARNLENEAVFYSFEDIINIIFYNKISFHKEMYYKYRKFNNKRYSIPGAGGESIRAHWDITPEQMTQQYVNRINRYPNIIREEMQMSLESVLNNSYEQIKQKYNITNPQSSEIASNMHREARCRSHFGTAVVDDYFTNSYCLAPLLDPMLRKLKLNDPNCLDKNLMMAVIYERYCPELLSFKFEGGRSIIESTIAYAKELSKKYSLKITDGLSNGEKEQFNIIVNDNSVIVDENNQLVEVGNPDKYLKAIFDTKVVKNIFCTQFDEVIYEYADKHYKKASYFSMRECYPVLAIVKTLLDVTNYDKFKEGCAFEVINQFTSLPQVNLVKDYRRMLDRINDYITARIDIKINHDGDLEIIQLSDIDAKSMIPTWFQKNGKGYVIESNNGVLDITVKALIDGELTIRLKGRDVRDVDNNRIAYWIDYQKFLYNSTVVFDRRIPAWHDKELVYQYPVMKDEIVRFHIEWFPHLGEKQENLSENSRVVSGTLEGQVEELYRLCTTINDRLNKKDRSKVKALVQKVVRKVRN